MFDRIGALESQNTALRTLNQELLEMLHALTGLATLEALREACPASSGDFDPGEANDSGC